MNTTKKENETDFVIDTRFQSYSRVHIIDIHKAEIVSGAEEAASNQSKKGIIRINNSLVNKVAICGLIVNIYESNKYYRLKIDDSTGCISVTLWKTSLFHAESLDSLKSTNMSQNHANKSSFDSFYKLLNGMQARIKDATVNARLIDEPRQGDLVLVRAQVKCFRQRIELNAISCTRVPNSTSEMMHMVLPGILNSQVYSRQSITCQQYEEIKAKKLSEQQLKERTNHQVNENLIVFVNKKLVEMTTGSDTLENNSCNSLAIFNLVKSSGANDFKNLTHKQVLDALKELESRGLAYSCEDEFHYLPI